jgi:DNA-binding ferritin-like protein
MGGYRDCCRSLCKALNESLRASDWATGALLSDLVLRLEKQLWLMDTSPHNRGVGSCRSVSLFLTC